MRKLLLTIIILLLFGNANLLADEIALAANSTQSFVRSASDLTKMGEVVFRTSSIVHSDQILLKDIADVHGFDNKNKRKLERMFLSRSPHPGEKRIFSDDYLRRIFKVGNSSGEWIIPESISVVRGSATISKEMVREIFREALIRQTKLPPDQVEVPEILMHGDLIIPSGEWNMTMSFAFGERFRGRATAKAIVSINDRKYKQFYITGKIKIFGDAIIVKKAVELGKTISLADVSLERVEISKAPNNLLYDISEVVGMESASSMNPGQMMTDNMIIAPVLIKRGEMISLIVQHGLMRVETKGIAQQDGRRKQLIKVKNISSNKIVYGYVTSSHEVNIRF